MFWLLAYAVIEDNLDCVLDYEFSCKLTLVVLIVKYKNSGCLMSTWMWLKKKKKTRKKRILPLILEVLKSISIIYSLKSFSIMMCGFAEIWLDVCRLSSPFTNKVSMCKRTEILVGNTMYLTARYTFHITVFGIFKFKCLISHLFIFLSCISVT